LRAFTWGTCFSCRRPAGNLTELARRAPLLPGADVLAFVDIDSMQKRPELPLLRTGKDPPGGDGAAGDDVLQVLLQVGEDRLEARDLLLEAGQRRLFVGRMVVDQARVAELVDRRLVGRAKRMLETHDDLDVPGQGQPSSFRRR